MWRACVSLVLVLAPAAARAGTLSHVVRGISEASDNDDGNHGSGSGGADGDGGGSSTVGTVSDTGCCWSDPASTLGTYYPPGPPGDVQTEVYAGAQSVEGSDGALTLEMRASWKDFGLGVRGTSFYERVGHDEYIHLDVWWIGGAWRLEHDDRLSAWVDVGLTGLNNNDELTMTGLALGARLHRELDGEFALVAGARRSWFEDDVSSTELMVGLQVAVLQVSYRLTDFSEGPPLHGPEVGIALRF
jgi:hypothetical protein